jgi:energy-coupling factor transport system ATP-binding protein
MGAPPRMSTRTASAPQESVHRLPALIQLTNVSYTYPETSTPALQWLNWHAALGSLTLVTGISGAGKSTLLRLLNGLVPHFTGGTLSGALRVAGLDPVQAMPQSMSRQVGFVFQDPESQFVMDRVEDEIAFALENAAIPPREMRLRVEETLDLLGLAHLRDRPLESLSGGERQRVAIGAALALRPPVLVLDEPTSQLDPLSAEDVLNAVARLNRDLGLTVVIAEHRLERVLPFADSLLYLPGGDAEAIYGPPRQVLAQIPLAPPLVQLGRRLGWEPLPLTVKEGLHHSRLLHPIPQPEPPSPAPTQPAAVQIKGVQAGYGAGDVLHNLSVNFYTGAITALMGRNGSGKTTLLKSLTGLIRPRRGEITIQGRAIAKLDVAAICRQVAYLPQDPNSLLFADTVAEELSITLRNHGYEPTAPATLPLDPAALLAEMGLSDHAGAYPRDLSTGQRQRAALAAVTVTAPPVILLDEPTRGLDYHAKAQLALLLTRWRQAGKTIIVVTHDVEWVATIADRVVLMSQGEIIADDTPAAVMAASPLFAPEIARLFPTTGWLTIGDAIAGLESR